MMMEPMTIWQHRVNKIKQTDKFKEMKEKSKNYLTTVGHLDDRFDERMDQMALDMVKREAERSGGDLMQFERRGLLPVERRKEIRVLDETNNECYKYLREMGNPWKYDPKVPHPKMKARLYRRFDTFDKDSDGSMSIDEVLYWADRMKEVCDTNDAEVESVRKALYSYFTKYGLSTDGLERENWVEAHMTMAAAAKERKKQGEIIPMEQLANAYFDVLDEDDDGFVTLEELKKMMHVFRVPEDAAYPFYEKADKDWNGTLDRQEMHDLFYRFWFGKYDAELDGVFGYKY